MYGKSGHQAGKGRRVQEFLTLVGQARGNVAVFQIRKLASVCGPEALRHERQQHQPGIYLRPPNPEFSENLEHEFTVVSCTRGESSAHRGVWLRAVPIKGNSDRFCCSFMQGPS